MERRTQTPSKRGIIIGILLVAAPKEKNNRLKERHFQQRERAAPAVSVLPEVVSGENSTRLCMGRSSLERIVPVYVHVCRP